MKKLNNNGQVLVLFVILLPVILLLLLITIEVGDVYIEKTKIKNIIKETITTSLKENLPNDAVNSLIDINIKNIKEKSIYTSESEIDIKLTKEEKIFGKTIEIKYNFKGIKENELIRISEG